MSTTGKVIQCKAAVCWAPHEPLVIEDIEVDPPQGSEVRVRMVSTSVCHSDLHCVAGVQVPGLYQGQIPVVLGHEGAGVVESVGSAVESIRPGDHVIPLFGSHCKKCAHCATGRSNMCLDSVETKGKGLMSDLKTRFRVRGQPLYHFVNTSTFSEYTIAEENNLAKINPKADLKTIGVLGCCIPTGVGAVRNTAKVTPGSTCAVWGLGAVGLSVVLGCKLAGAKTIVGIDISPHKEELGKKMGCTHFVNPKTLTKPIAAYLQEEFDGGLDFTFESIGNLICMKDAFESAHMGWGVCTVIGVTGSEAHIEVNALKVLMGAQLRGCIFGDYNFKEDLPALVEDVVSGKIRCDDFITEKMELKDINRAVETMRAGKGIRSVILY